MQNKNIDYIKLHISVLLSGFTGILAKLISLNEVPIVWYRMLISFVFFGLKLILTHKKPDEKPKEALKICGLGAILAIHLMFFFGSIKYSNVSVGAVCYSLVGFFTVIFEPIILKTKFSVKELFYSLIAILGIGLIFNFDISFRFGIVLGIISAATFALYTLFNQKIQVNKSSRIMLFYELLGGTIFMSIFLPIYNHFDNLTTIIPVNIDWLWLVILSVLCTVLLYLLHISVLKTLSAFTVSITGNLEPIYGVLFAIIFLQEANSLTLPFYIGMILIFISVFLQSIAKNKLKF